METKIQFTSLANVGEALLKAYSTEGEVTENSSWARMKSILGIKGSEGFFANAVILVEGQEDEAILTAYAEHKNVSLDNQGIAIIPAESKTKIPSLLVLYGKLGLRTFALFDGDGNQSKPKDAHVDTNKALLCLMGEKPEERPKTKVYEGGAVWENDFAETIKDELGGANWDEAYQKACIEYLMNADEGKKKFAVIRRTVGILLKNGNSSSTLDNLWKAITVRCGIK